MDFPIFLLFFCAKFPIFPIFSVLSFLFSYFFEQPCCWTPCIRLGMSSQFLLIENEVQNLLYLFLNSSGHTGPVIKPDQSIAKYY